MATSKPKSRLRFGIRGWLAAIFALAILLGWFSHLRRQVARQEALVAGLERDGIRVNHRRPTLLCFALMKLLSTDNLDIETRFGRWIGRGWFYRPGGFNAGRLPEARSHAVADGLARLGDVWEVTYIHPSLDGLKLFYIDTFPRENLGPHGSTCVIRHHPAARLP